MNDPFTIDHETRFAPACGGDAVRAPGAEERIP